MMCYRDMTFCTFWEDCKNVKDCNRPLTQKVLDAAEEWMENPPICKFSAKPECHEVNMSTITS